MIKVHRVLSIPLGLGGVVGMGITLFYSAQRSWTRWTDIFPLALLFFSFYWTARQGRSLWRNEARGWLWAKRLYALQIPFVVVPGLAYRYLVGIYICLIAGDADDNVKIGLGADAMVRLD